MKFTIKNQVFGEGVPKICVPLVATTKEGLVKEAQLAKDSTCEVVEWRGDLFEAVHDVEAVLATLEELRKILAEKLLLFTFRTIEEGGKREFSLREYQGLYETVAKSQQVDMLDVELGVAEFLGRGFIQKLKARKMVIVMSYHNFDKTPADGEMVLKVSVMKQFGADMGKISVMPHSLKDVLGLMNLSVKLQGLVELPLILISMGDLGKTTRISGELIQSVMTFGALTTASAPGQIPVEELRNVLNVMKLEKSEEHG